jgi:uncharacterized membrane protein YesL
MGADLVYILIVTRLCWSPFSLMVVCFLLGRGQKYIFMVLYHLDVMLENLIKASFIKKHTELVGLVFLLPLAPLTR